MEKFEHGLTKRFRQRGRLPVRPDTNPRPPPPWTPQPILVSTWLGLAI